MVLGLLIGCNQASARDIKLLCDHTTDGTVEILFMNDKKKSLAIEDVPGINSFLTITNFNKDVIEGNKINTSNGKIIQKMFYTLDRRTGILTLQSFLDGNLYIHNYKCKLFKENKF
mgnify:CR=1 FL=1